MSNDQEHDELLQQGPDAPRTMQSANSLGEAEVNKRVGRKKVTHAMALQASAEALEWKVNKCKESGDEAGALQSSEHLAILRRMAKDASVTARRESFRVVSSTDLSDKQ